MKMENTYIVPMSDPPVPDWMNLSLPDAWPDTLDLTRPADLLRLLRHMFGRRQRPLLPAGMPGMERVPKYVLQEFHSLPNGNYSKKITHGYVTGFDRLMLGRMTRARRHIASALQNCRAVLDVGCGGGGTAATLRSAGIAEVWAIDPSPYLLAHAARACPGVNFVQAIAEDTRFPSARFDGISACFVMHEMPPHYIERALREFHRVLKPGGLLAVCEPSSIQLQLSPWRLLRRDGVLGCYFWLLAHLVHEPFVDAWHKQSFGELLRATGFELLDDHVEMPVRHVLARRLP